MHAGNRPPRLVPTPRIVLDYTKLSFNATHKTIAWKFEDSQSCTSPITFAIQLSTCDVNNPTDSWITPYLEYTFPSSVFDANGPLYFRIVARSAHKAAICTESSKYQIHSDCECLLTF